jgi:hypothetical protein
MAAITKETWVTSHEQGQNLPPGRVYRIIEGILVGTQQAHDERAAAIKSDSTDVKPSDA